MGSSSSKLNTGAKLSAQKGSPPSYETTAQTHPSKSFTSSPGFPNTGIRASDVPRWRWNNHQCIEWIAAVLTEYYYKERVEAERIARKFPSFGPMIWSYDAAKWTTLLGQNGLDMFYMIFEMYQRRKEVGGVPMSMAVPEMQGVQR